MICGSEKLAASMNTIESVDSSVTPSQQRKRNVNSAYPNGDSIFGVTERIEDALTLCKVLPVRNVPYVDVESLKILATCFKLCSKK